MTLTVAGETIGKTLSIPVTVAKVGDLSMVNGASICLLPNTFGIRFTAKVNYQDATKVFESVEFGILFTKKSNVNSADDFTFEGLEGKEYVNYSSESDAFDYAQNGSEYTFSYQVTGLSADDLNTDYTAARMIGYLAQGMFDNVWYNYRIYFFFFVLLALGAALKDASGKEAKK